MHSTIAQLEKKLAISNIINNSILVALRSTIQQTFNMITNRYLNSAGQSQLDTGEIAASNSLLPVSNDYSVYLISHID